ncbi:MAG: hypothetical protein KGH72_01810 [Candidatus Micrarchaeota archaeon]|nr:hypothetical protein [Candidatus Micrarchaeota archaeon]
MNKRFALYAAVVAFLALAGGAGAQSFLTNYSAFNNWLPVVGGAISLGFVIAGVYYMVGALLNNQKVKSGAISQFLQVLGTLIILVAVVMVLNYFGTVLTIPQLLPPSTIMTLCHQLGYGGSGGPAVDFLNAGKTLTVNGNPIPEPGQTLCADVIAPAGGGGSLTTNLDYGLASTYMIEDNLTNQSLREMNDMYDWESMVYWLRSYVVTYSFCIPVECAIPLPSPPETTGDFLESTQVSFRYFSGYVQGRLITPAVTVEMNLMFYLYMMQLVIIIMMLLMWPYVLAAGIVLRAFSYTQRAGGLLIAIVLVSLLVYPTIILFQYNTLSNVQNLQPIGTGQTPSLALCGRSVQWTSSHSGAGLSGVYCYTEETSLPTSYIFKGIIPQGFPWSGNKNIPACSGTSFSSSQNCYVKKTINFYVFPRLADIPNLYSYWPGPNLVPMELDLTFHDTIPLNGGIQSLFRIFYALLDRNFNSGIPEVYTGLVNSYDIGPHYIINTYTTMENLYGMLAVSGFIIPILDMMILVSATTGLSSVLGGETTLLGLSRFL